MTRTFLQRAPWLVCVLLLSILAVREIGFNGLDSAFALTPPVLAGAPLTAGIRLDPAPARYPRETTRSAMAVQMVQTVPLVLSSTKTTIGTVIYATATIKNVGARPISIKNLLAGGRGPNITGWDCGTRTWADCGAEFGIVQDITILPGQEYAYRELRVPNARGNFWARMVYLDAETQEWREASGSNQVTYSVTGGEIVVVSPLVLTPANPRPGQPVTATAQVRNIGELPLEMRYLLAAGRGPDCTDWNCNDWDWYRIADFSSAEDIVLQPGQTYVYQGITPGRSRGLYFTEMIYQPRGFDLWRSNLGGTNRVNYTPACDARCDTIVRAYTEITGREPDPAAMHAVYDSSFNEEKLRAYLCGSANRKPAACGTVAQNAIERFFSFLPVNPRSVLKP